MTEPALTITDARIKFVLSLVAVVGFVYGTSQYMTDKISRLEALERLTAVQQTQIKELRAVASDLKVKYDADIDQLEDEIRDVVRDLQIHSIRHEQLQRD